MRINSILASGDTILEHIPCSDYTIMSFAILSSTKGKKHNGTVVLKKGSGHRESSPWTANLEDGVWEVDGPGGMINETGARAKNVREYPFSMNQLVNMAVVAFIRKKILENERLTGGINPSVPKADETRTTTTVAPKPATPVPSPSLGGQDKDTKDDKSPEEESSSVLKEHSLQKIYENLTPQRKKVVTAFACGFRTNKEIALRLKATEVSVNFQMSQALGDFGLRGMGRGKLAEVLKDIKLEPSVLPEVEELAEEEKSSPPSSLAGDNGVSHASVLNGGSENHHEELAENEARILLPEVNWTHEREHEDSKSLPRLKERGQGELFPLESVSHQKHNGNSSPICSESLGDILQRVVEYKRSMTPQGLNSSLVLEIKSDGAVSGNIAFSGSFKEHSETAK